MSNEITKIPQMPINEIMSIGKAFVESGSAADVGSFCPSPTRQNGFTFQLVLSRP